MERVRNYRKIEIPSNINKIKTRVFNVRKGKKKNITN